MSTKVLNGMEIFSIGQWNKDVFTVDDLDHIVDAFHTLGHSGRLPLKLGHEGPDGRIITGERDKDGKLTDPMSQLAMGWVLDIYREGTKLYANVEVPDKVYQLLESKHLKFVSIELFREVRASRRTFPWVMDAVALLGTDQPAVGILTDIQTLTMSAREVLPHAAFKTFARAECQSINFGVNPQMAEGDKVTLESLSQQMIALTGEVSKLREENSGLKAQVAEGNVVKTNFKALQAQVEQQKITTHRDAIKGMLEAAVKSEDLQPYNRDRFMKAYKIDSDDEILMGLSIDDVKDFIKQNPNPAKKKKEGVRAFSVASPSDEIPDDIDPDKGMVVLMQAQLKQDGKANSTNVQDIIAAAKRAMQANPDAARRYQSQQNEIGLVPVRGRV